MAYAHRVLVLVLSAFLVPPSLFGAPAPTPKIMPAPPGDKESIQLAASELNARRSALDLLLAKAVDSKDPVAQQAAMNNHWQAMQSHMAATLALMQPMAPRSGQPDCRVIGSQWPGLSFPRQVSASHYQAKMMRHANAMREDVGRLRNMTDPAEFQSALRDHWDRNYQVMQEMRGLGWMFDAWMPATKQGGTPPEPLSDGARLLERNCTLCHARPSPVLHTAQEWDRLMRVMVRHMELSDGGPPMCVRVASDNEQKLIGDYLRRHARQTHP